MLPLSRPAVLLWNGCGQASIHLRSWSPALGSGLHPPHSLEVGSFSSPCTKAAFHVHSRARGSSSEMERSDPDQRVLSLDPRARLHQIPQQEESWPQAHRASQDECPRGWWMWAQGLRTSNQSTCLPLRDLAKHSMQTTSKGGSHSLPAGWPTWSLSPCSRTNNQKHHLEDPTATAQQTFPIWLTGIIILDLQDTSGSGRPSGMRGVLDNPEPGVEELYPAPVGTSLLRRS